MVGDTLWLETAASAFDAPTDKAFEKLGFTPNPGPQTRFLSLPDDNLDVLYGGAAGGSKMQRVDEPVPTPDGWTTIGDLQPGDHVFTETGAVCSVTAVHPIDLHPVSYRLTFDDGTSIEACADHLWLTLDACELAALTKRSPEYRAARRARRPSSATGRRSELFTATVSARNRAKPPLTLPAPAGTVRTTKEIAATLRTARGRINHAVPVAGALHLPEADLPIDPYVLGAWLGDGHTAGAGFTTADPEILAHFRSAGWPVTDLRSPTRKYAYRIGETVTRPRSNGRPGLVNTFTTVLRSLGVLGSKHIPQVYLRASAAQRLALLQGLMDTDGGVNRSGQPSFTTTSRQLADGMYELIVSLGWKVQRQERRATLNGKDCGPVWSFKWTPDRIVFRLARKAGRQVLARRRTTRFRYITGCEETEPTPMRCITVSNPAGLYLTSRSMVPTHNTTSLLMFALRSCDRYPGLQAFWFRRTFPELEQSVLRTLVRFQYAAPLGAKWNEGKHELRFSNGSVLTFAHAKNEQEASALLSAEINLLLIDERTTLPPVVVELLYSRVRSGVAGVPCLGVRSATNPGQIGHAQAKAGYVDATQHGQIEITDRYGRRRIFIQARLSDTPQLGEEYRKVLAGLPEKLRKAYEDGDWSTFEGQMFTELAWDRHVVPPMTIPASWRRFAGVDWGYTAPWAVLWAAQDEDGRLWLYREIYEAGVGETDQAKRILAAEAGEDVGVRYADDAMWAVRGDALPIATVYASEGCHLTPAGKGPGSRVAGWQRIHTYLKDAPACPHHRAQGWDECPKLHVFTTLTNWYAEMESLPHATTGDPEDADTKAADHIADATRYLLINLGGGPQFPILPAPAENPFDEVEQLRPLSARFGFRPDEDAELFDDGLGDDGRVAVATTQISPFA